MNVNFNGTLRLVTGRKSIRLELSSGAVLMDVLRELIRLYPALREELLEMDGGLRTDLPIFINGRNPRLFPESMNAIARPEDTLSLFSPVSSGRMNVEGMREPGTGKVGDKNEG